MNPEDVTFLSNLWVEAWQRTMPAIDFAARRPWLIDFLAAPGRATLVAEDAAGLCGFATCEGDLLHQLVVSVAHLGRGTAARLVAACKARSPGGLVLDVNQDNLRAVRFYEREGFAIEAAGCNRVSGLAIWRMRWRGPDP